MVYAVLGRLRSGRLARHVQVHAELRHPPRTRGRVARSRQPTDGRVRSERHEPHRRVRSENRLARRPHTQRRLDLRRRERRTDRARQSEEDQAGAARRRDVRDRREHPRHIAVPIGYIGATGRDINFCGTNDCSININQIDPALARQMFPLGSGWDAGALRQSIPNPFFGIAQAGELGTSPTIQRGQLLRPFPEFGNVLMHESTAGSKRQYNALSVELDKRVGAGTWGGRLSYTYSVSKDNQWGESNTYSSRFNGPQNNYDLAAEYSYSVYDSPHRIILAPIVNIPAPMNRNSMAYLLGGGWTASAVVELVSGAPLKEVMSGGASDANLGLFGGRQRPNLVGDPNTSGSDDERVATTVNPDAKYFNAGAFANPGVGQYGNAPRTDGSARYQFRKNIDLVVSKATRLTGSQSGEIRFEILNLTNTAKFNGIDSTSIDSSAFGRISTQAGFMRIWQLSFRYRF